MSATVEKALKVLELLSTHGQPVRLADLSRELEMNKSTTYRLLEKMGQLGYVRQDEDSRYMLTTRMWAIGVRAFRNFDIRAWARRHLEELARETGETAVLAVLEGADVVIIDKRDSDHAVQTLSPLGSRSPLHTSSLGKALLLGDFATLWPQMKRPAKFTERTLTSLAKLKAEIDRARETGVTEAYDEYNVGVSGIAAPIHGVDGALLGTIGITLPTARCEDAHLAQIRVAVRTHADRLSKALGGIG
ncbi:IclR family transcriptional regulator [Frigidibacter sp. MR17.14]|uniref:IclR family transcriptional regulator n=1 Tax=Frigidibacter sp. MR17.14 TaxID=3126509 RepID=UPI003012DD95